MDWRNQGVFLTAFVLALLIGRSHGALGSSPAVTFKFGQCMVEKMSQSPLFSAEDKDELSAMAAVLYNGLRRVTNTENGQLLNKALLKAFITSLCEIALSEEFAPSQSRKRELLISAENCSLSVIGQIDTNFFQEITRIFFALRPVFSTTQRAPSNSHGAFSSSSSQVAQTFIPQQAFVGPIVRPQTGTTSFAGPVVRPQTGATSFAGPVVRPQTGVPSFGGPIMTPQTGATSFVGPIVRPQTAASSFAGPIARPQADATSFSYSSDEPQQPSSIPEDLIANVLLNSPVFSNVFQPGISNNDAINIGRAIVEKSMTGFNPRVITDASNFAANAMLMRSQNWNTRDFAVVISRSISEVLNHYGIPLSAHASRIGNTIISDLQAHFGNTGFSNVNSQGVQAQVQQAPTSEEFIAKPMQGQPNNPPLAIINLPTNDQASFMVQESNTQKNTSSLEEIAASAVADTAADSASGEELFSPVLDKEFILSQCLLMARNALSPYGIDTINKATMEIKNQFQSIPDGSAYPTYAEAFSRALINTLVSQNLMGVINPEQLSKSMLEVISSQDASSIMPTKLEMQAPRIIPAPVLLEEPRSKIPSSSEDIGAEFISSQAMNMTEAALVPLDNSSPKVEDTSAVETQLESSSAISKTESAISENQQKESEGLPVKTESAVNSWSTVMPINENPDKSMQNFSLKIGNFPVEDMFPTTTFDVMSGSTQNPDFLFTDMPPQLESSNGPVDYNSKDETAVEPNDYDFPEEEKSDQNHKTEVAAPEKSNPRKDETDNSKNLEKTFSSEVAETPRAKNQSTDTKRIASDVFQQNKTSSSVELQPSFQSPTEQGHENTEDYDSEYEDYTESPPETATDYELEDPTVVFARQIVSISASAISYIRGGMAFDLNQLCANLNRLAPVVDISPLTYCSEIALIDYILNILMEVTKILRNI